MYKIKIKFDKLSFTAELNDSPTSKAIWDQLPMESRVNTWGEEIYFEIPVNMPQEPHAQEILSSVIWLIGQSVRHSVFSSALLRSVPTNGRALTVRSISWEKFSTIVMD